MVLSEIASRKVTLIKIVRNGQAQVIYKVLLDDKSLLASLLDRWETDSKNCSRAPVVLT